MIVVSHDCVLNVELLKVECFVLKRERMRMKKKGRHGRKPSKLYRRDRDRDRDRAIGKTSVVNR